MNHSEFEQVMAKRRRISETETFDCGRVPLSTFKNPAAVPTANFNATVATPAKIDAKHRTVAALTQQLENRISAGKRLHGVAFGSSDQMLAAACSPVTESHDPVTSFPEGHAASHSPQPETLCVQPPPQKHPASQEDGKKVPGTAPGGLDMMSFDASKMGSAAIKSTDAPGTSSFTAKGAHPVQSDPSSIATSCTSSGLDSGVFAVSDPSSIARVAPAGGMYCSYYSDATNLQKRQSDSVPMERRRHEYLQRIVDVVDEASARLKAMFGCSKRRS